jgi:HEAT repeat protein
MDVLQVFWSPEFIAQAVEAFDRWSRGAKSRPAAAFLLALGAATVPGLLDLYAQDETPGGRRPVFDLLASYGEPAVAEAVKRLQDPRLPYVRNLLMLIRRVAAKPDVVPAVRPLLQHRDTRVRLEALAVLLRFREPVAVTQLRQEILSADPDVAFQAVALAAQYRVTDVVEKILSLLKSVIFFESDYASNEELIKALGEIGDPRALPELEKLAKSGLSLYPARHAQMKQRIFESLERYPKENIAGLLRIGERSNDEKIRSICRRLADRA